MNGRMTDKEVRDFLTDFAEYSETEVLEEGKQKNEIIAIAKAKGINLKNNKDLAGFKTIYTFANKANKNRARLPKKALLKALPSMIAKPVDIDHDRRYVVGHYIDYRYRSKEDMVIAYGVFYKSNFGDEWEEAKRLIKAKKLSTSYEIWCPEDKKRALPDGTFELLQQEIAGGALLFKSEPAFEDAKVLELAKKHSEVLQDELIFAKKYKAEEIIQVKKVVEDRFITEKELRETPKEEVVKTPKSITIKCSNCEHSWEIGNNVEHRMGSEKCPKCFAILQQDGTMIYPPQIKDFRIICPGCRINNWLILSRKDEKGKLRCLNCSKEYDILFDIQRISPLIDKLDFVYEGSVSCYQCNREVYFSGVSSIKTTTVKCKKCGLEFSHDITKTLNKKIAKITQIAKVTKTSKKGGTEMNKNKVTKASEEKIVTEHNFLESSEKNNQEVISERIEKTKAEEAKVESVVEAEQKDEAKVEEEKVDEPKAEEQPEVKAEKQEAPKVEENNKCDKCKKDTCDCEKVVPKEEPKAEEKPVEEPKVENKKEATEAKIEEAKEDKVKKYAKGIRKLAKSYKELKKNMKDKIAFYKANAVEINKRREDLGDFGNTLSDKEILIDENFAKVKADMENDKIEKSSVVGEKVKDDGYYTRIRKEIDDQAFSKKD